jgi:hypothetical protein
VLFGLVKKHGLSNTKVVLHGELPVASAPEVARRTPAPRDQPAVERRRTQREQPSYDRQEYSRRYESPDYYSRRGYWVQRRDGVMVFIDREPEYRPQPYFYGRRGWY